VVLEEDEEDRLVSRYVLILLLATMMIVLVHAIDLMLIPVNMKKMVKKVKKVKKMKKVKKVKKMKKVKKVKKMKKVKKVKKMKKMKKHHDPMIPTMIVCSMMQTSMHSSILPLLIDVLHLVMSVRSTKTMMSLMSFV
jgi:hypothetical protein